MNKTKITLLTGYLGSGKTTLINHILKNQDGYKIAVIVNDIGEINIDSELILKNGYIKSTDTLVSLQNGCICCNLKGDLIAQIIDICNINKFDHILIEASGICEPMPIVESIYALNDLMHSKMLDDIVCVDSVITVVDANRLKDEFNCGSKLKEDFKDDEDIESLIVQQLEFCNIIILNKVSLVNDLELNSIKEVIKSLQPKASIIECDFANVPIDKIIDVNLFDFGTTFNSATWVKELDMNHDDEEHSHTLEYGVSTFVYTSRHPFDKLKFSDFIDKFYDSSIIRCKGIIYFKDEFNNCLLFEGSGKQKVLSNLGVWNASLPIEKQKILRENNSRLNDDWDNIYGDRMIKLVFIGKDMNKEKIVKELDNCLVD